MEGYRITRVLFANVSGFLAWNEKTCILIDTGHTSTVHKLEKVLERIGKTPRDIRLIILTHTHFDHAGGAAEIKKLTGAPLAVHSAEASFLEKGRTPFPRGTRWKAKALYYLGNTLARRMASYPALKPDILVDEMLDLAPFGIEGRIIHTPGHTAGSLSILFPDHKAMVGDNLLGIPGKPCYPPFANDRPGVFRAWDLYIDEGIKELYPAHGNKVQISRLSEEMPGAMKRYL